MPGKIVQPIFTPNFCMKFLIKKYEGGCVVGLILSENVESAENNVNMQYQVNPMHQTQDHFGTFVQV